jgi:hypothetical protein
MRPFKRPWFKAANSILVGLVFAIVFAIQKCKWVGIKKFPLGGPKSFPYVPPVFEF